MSRRGTRWVGAIGAIVAVLTVALQLLNAVDLRTEATVLVALLAALAGFVAQRAIAVGQSRADEAERDRVLDDALAWWPPPLVGEADPYELGAFPPESGDYVDRAADEKLQAALAEPGYVVAVGPVGAGKSRAAFQALQATVPLAALLVPEDGESLGRLIAADPQLPGGEQGTVLWLDCIDRFIPGLRLDAVDRWVGDGNVRVVGTLAEDQRDKLVKAGGPEGHIARRLLGRAAVVTVKDTLTAAEAEAAGAAFPERDFSTGMAGAFREALAAVGRSAAAAVRHPAREAALAARSLAGADDRRGDRGHRRARPPPRRPGTRHASTHGGADRRAQARPRRLRAGDIRRRRGQHADRRHRGRRPRLRRPRDRRRRRARLRRAR